MMSLNSESEEKEQLVATSPPDGQDCMVEIKRNPRVPGHNRLKTPPIDQTDPPKRTYTYTDTLNSLPDHFIENITNGTYDKNLNEIDSPTRGYIRGCTQNGNWCSCLWITVLFISILLFSIGLSIDSYNGGYILVLIPIGISWFLYSAEWYFISSTPDDLSIVKSKDSADEFIQKLHKMKPQIIWKGKCFHYEWEQDKTTVKVITHKFETEYSYKRSRDHYTRCVLNEYELTRLTLFKTFTFADSDTKTDYERKFNAFCDEHHKDDYQHVDVLMKIPDEFEFKTRILVNAKYENTGKYWSNKWYNIMSCLCLSPCYRVKFHSVTGIKSHIIQKEITALPMFVDI
eukprot:30168_1